MTMIMRDRILADEAESKGIEKGMEKGMKKSALSIAAEMLKNNLSVDFISKMTKLSKDEITGLQKELALA